MPSDNFATYSPALDSPALDAVAVTAGQIHDTTDLPNAGRALSVFNGTGANIVLPIVTPRSADGAPVYETVLAGTHRLIPFGAKRIKSTGATGLAAGITAGTVIVNLITV